MIRSEALKVFPHLIAYADGVDANTAATTNLTFVNDATLSDHAITFAVIEFVSGDLTAGIVSVETASGNVDGLKNIILDGCLSSVMLIQSVVAAIQSNTGTIDCTVGTPSTNPGTFNIKVYGLSL